MKLLSLSPVVFLLVTSACSSSSSEATPTPCNEDPWTCPAGQTCWPKDTVGTFGCLASAAGKVKGDTCANTVGSPTCGDALACFQGVGDSTGHCVAYCNVDPANGKALHPCASGETCQTAMLAGTSKPFHVCIPTATMMDAGTDSTPSDTGSSMDSSTDSSTDDAADGASSD